jgi:O-antigen ligase
MSALRRQILEHGPRVRRALLLGAIAGVPLLVLRQANDPFNVPKFTLLCVIVAAVAGTRILESLQGADNDGLRSLAIPALAVGGPLVIAWLFTAYKGWTLLGDYTRYQGLVPYLVVIAAGVLIADAFRGRAHQAAAALVVGAVGTAAYGLIQVAGLDPYEWASETGAGEFASSTIGNPNFTGSFIAIALPVGLVLWRSQRGPTAHVVVGVALAVLAAGLLATQSQGPLAAAIAGLAVTGGLLLSNRYRWSPVLGLLAAAAIAALVVGQVLFGMLRPNHALVPNSVQLRSEAWEGAADMALDNPIFGRGPNVYAVEGPHHRTIEDAVRLGFSYPDDPHSVPLSFVTAAGILGLAGFVAVFAWVFLTGRRHWKGNEYAVGFVGATVAYLVQALVSIDELSLRFALWVCLAGLVASLSPAPQAVQAAAPRRGRRRRRRAEPMRAPALALIPLILVAAALWWAGRFFLADVHASRGFVRANQGRLEEARREFDAAVSYRNDQSYMRMYANEVGTLALQAKDVDALHDAIEHLSYLEDFPNPAEIADYGRLLHFGTRIDPELSSQAAEAYERAGELDPLNPLIAVYTTDLFVELDREREALDLLERFLPLMDRPLPREVRTYDDFWGAVALARVNLDDPEGARAAAERALEVNPEEERALTVLSALGR